MSVRGRFVRVGKVAVGVLPEAMQRPIYARADRFNAWRDGRPFWGGALLMFAGLLTAWAPVQFSLELALIGSWWTVVGLVFALGMFLSGAFALSRPDLATYFGIAGIVFSLASLIGALGGYLVGLFIGVFGGNLCIAWNPGEEEEEATTPTGIDTETTTEPTEDVQFSWEGES